MLFARVVDIHLEFVMRRDVQLIILFLVILSVAFSSSIQHQSNEATLSYHALHRVPSREQRMKRHLSEAISDTSETPRRRRLLEHRPEHLRSNLRSLRERPSQDSTAVFTGYGTHYTYVYVGTPPQRQSLIIHTASKYTTFTCSGCTACGVHKDPYYDWSSSNTSKVQTCNGDDLCYMNQTYAEGSSWEGFRVRDVVYVGNDVDVLDSTPSMFALNLSFACQSKLSGLFQKQVENGILGMSGDEDAMPWQLLSQKAIDHKIFALCFDQDGGIMTLGRSTSFCADTVVCFMAMTVTCLVGGINPSFHLQRNILYAALEERMGGLYGLRVHKIRLETPPVGGSSTWSSHDLNDNEKLYEPGITTPKGSYLDSATSDTFLPRRLFDSFSATFKQLTKGKVDPGVNPALSLRFDIDPETYALLPDIVFDFYGVLSQAKDAKFISVRMKPSQYLAEDPDPQHPHRYAFRIFFRTPTGILFGSNFFLDHNVIFDLENRRIGFVPANCSYPVYAMSPTSAPTQRPSIDPIADNDVDVVCPATLPGVTTSTMAEADLLKYYRAESFCSASCAANEAAGTSRRGDGDAFIASGSQLFHVSCRKDDASSYSIPDRVTRPCRENCTDGRSVRGDPNCPDSPWSTCSAQCTRSRQLVLSNTPLYTRTGLCNYVEQNAPCFMHECPLISNKISTSTNKDGQQTVEPEREHIAVISMVWTVLVPMELPLPMANWTYAHEESIAMALTKVLPVKFHNIEISVDNDDANRRKVVTLGIRLRSSDYLNPSGGDSHRQRHQRRRRRRLTSTTAPAALTTPIHLSTILSQVRTAVHDRHFFNAIVQALDEAAYSMDSGELHRFAAFPSKNFALQSFGIHEYKAHRPSTSFLALSGLDIALIVLLIVTVVALLVVWRLHSQLQSEYILMVQKSSLQQSQGPLSTIKRQFNRLTSRFTFRPSMVTSFDKVQRSLATMGLMQPPTSSSTSNETSRSQRRSECSHNDDDDDYNFLPPVNSNRSFRNADDDSDTDSARAASKERRWTGEPGIEMMSRY